LQHASQIIAKDFQSACKLFFFFGQVPIEKCEKEGEKLQSYFSNQLMRVLQIAKSFICRIGHQLADK